MPDTEAPEAPEAAAAPPDKPAPARQRRRKPKGEGPEMAERDHLDGCPATPDRIETIRGTRPATATRAAAKVTVVRCIDCGGQTATTEE